MLNLFVNTILVVAATLLQISFLSRLPSPISDLALITAVAAWLIVKDRPDEAFIWFILGGIIFDLHSPYGFGTELVLAGSAYLVMRFLFVRVLSNDSYAAVFLLAGAGILIRFAGLASLDGMRVLFGHEPYLLIGEPELITRPILGAVTTGVAAIGLTACANLVKFRLETMFLSSRSKLKL